MKAMFQARNSRKITLHAMHNTAKNRTKLFSITDITCNNYVFNSSFPRIASIWHLACPFIFISNSEPVAGCLLIGYTSHTLILSTLSMYCPISGLGFWDYLYHIMSLFRWRFGKSILYKHVPWFLYIAQNLPLFFLSPGLLCWTEVGSY